MENEVIRIFWSSYLTAYERIGKRDKGVAKYFSTCGLEFKNIRAVEKFIKDYEIVGRM